MKKKVGKILTLMLSFVFACGSFAACNGDDEKKLIADPDVLRLFVWEGGYGSEWVKALEKGFEALYPEINVDITTTPLRERVQLEWEVSSTSNRYDILMVDGDNADVAYTKYRVPGLEYAFAQVDDVFEMKPAGEEDGDKTVADKMMDGVPEYFTQFDVNNGMTFSFPTVTTMSGWVYNKEVLADCGIEVLPRTTDEFIEVCRTVKAHGYTPIIFAGGTDYYTGRFIEWWVQYNGYEDYVHYCAGEAYDEMMGDWRYSTKIFDQKGRLYSLEVMEELYGYKGGAADPECFIDTQATGYRFMDAQQKFMDKVDGKYQYAFMSNGGWIENEMREFFAVGSVPLGMMQVPLLSDIVYMDKTLDREAQTPVMDETKLRDCVSYFRGEGAKPDGVSDEVLNHLEAAYNRVSGGSLGYAAVIPASSKKIDLAKRFLSYMYSDEAIELVAESNCGAVIAADYDYSQMETYSSLTDLQRDVMDAMDEKYEKNVIIRSHPIVYKGGLGVIRGNLFTSFASTNPDDRKSAKTLFDEHAAYFNNGTTWDDLLRTAGVM